MLYNSPNKCLCKLGASKKHTKVSIVGSPTEILDLCNMCVMHIIRESITHFIGLSPEKQIWELRWHFMKSYFRQFSFCLRHNSFSPSDLSSYVFLYDNLWKSNTYFFTLHFFLQYDLSKPGYGAKQKFGWHSAK